MAAQKLGNTSLDFSLHVREYNLAGMMHLAGDHLEFYPRS